MGHSLGKKKTFSNQNTSGIAIRQKSSRWYTNDVTLRKWPHNFLRQLGWNEERRSQEPGLSLPTPNSILLLIPRCLSNLQMHTNHSKVLLKYWHSDPVGQGKDLRIRVSNKLRGEGWRCRGQADADGRRTTYEALSKGYEEDTPHPPVPGTLNF